MALHIILQTGHDAGHRLAVAASDEAVFDSGRSGGAEGGERAKSEGGEDSERLEEEHVCW